MPKIDLNALKNDNPHEYSRKMLIRRGGELRVAKEKVLAARNSVERDQAQAAVDQAETDVAYYRREIKRLSQSTV